MTIHTPITVGCVNEAPRETTWSKEFANFLPILANYIETQQDLEDISHSYDPAYSIWNRDAEVADARVMKSLQELHDLPVHLPEDRPLYRCARLVHAMLDSSVPSRPRHLHRQMQIAFFQQYQVPGFGPTAQNRNSILIRARHLIDAMAQLSLFDFNPEEEIDATGLPEAVEMLSSGF